MAEINNVIAEASQDLQTIEDFVNLPAGSEVYPRLLPSVNVGTLAGTRDAIFEAGGLPATPFATKALMTASALVDGDFAQVTDDTVNNGLYVKTEGSWVKSDYDPLAQMVGYVDANPLFKPKKLSVGDNADNLGTGRFYITSTDIAEGVLNLPNTINKPSSGIVDSFKEGGVGYQLFTQYRSLEQWERVGNGGTSSFAWGDWTKIVKQADLTSLATSVNDALIKKPSINLFKNIELTSVGAESYSATVIKESGFTTLVMNTDAVSTVYYTQDIDNKYFNVGDTVEFSAEIFSDEIGTASGDISMQAVSATGSTIIATSASNASSSIKNTWHTVSIPMVLPSGTVKIRLRFIRRLGNTVVKFRNPQLTSNSAYSKFIYPLSTSAGQASNTVFVKKTGLDTNLGTFDAPFLTIQKAVDSVSTTGGTVKVLDSEEYRESVNVNSHGHVRIVADRNNRVNIFGSDKLVVTKTAGYTKVYQAPLDAKPTGMGDDKGKPMIAEWGTPSKPIPDSERHYLQRGLPHRLPYTEMNEATSIAELDTVNGKWFWEAGIIYLSATDGGDATTKRYEARVRQCLTHTNGTIELIRVNSWFSNLYGMSFRGLATTRQSCITYGAQHNGFADNANVTRSYRDIAGGHGNDGFNGTDGDYRTLLETNSRLDIIYFDPYSHDNMDDGFSCHYRSDSTIYGGLLEYNRKGDVVHVTGSSCVCYNTVARGTESGFSSTTLPGLDTERNKTLFKCVGTESINNNLGYSATSGGHLTCVNTTATESGARGYSQGGDGVLIAQDCKYVGDMSKSKNGAITIINSAALV